MDLRNYKLQQDKFYDSSVQITIVHDLKDYLKSNKPEICKLIISAENDLSNIKNEILKVENVDITIIISSSI